MGTSKKKTKEKTSALGAVLTPRFGEDRAVTRRAVRSPRRLAPGAGAQSLGASAWWRQHAPTPADKAARERQRTAIERIFREFADSARGDDPERAPTNVGSATSARRTQPSVTLVRQAEFRV